MSCQEIGLGEAGKHIRAQTLLDDSCDSHSLQLIMMDIVDPKGSKVPRAGEVLRSAIEIVVFFHHSSEQGRLRSGDIGRPLLRRSLQDGVRNIICSPRSMTVKKLSMSGHLSLLLLPLLGRLFI